MAAKNKGIQFIKNTNGKVEYVILPVKNAAVQTFLEDFGLAQAILEAQEDPVYSKTEALRQLNK